MKWLKKLSIGIGVFISLIVFVWILYSGTKFLLPIDISQDYKNVQNVENIIFKQNWKQQCYKRCFWGLEKIEYPQSNSSEILCESDDSIYELQDYIETDNEIRQSIYSPDKKYILYCEIEYDYNHSGITDDEYCYYRVYETETDTVVTIYQAYKEWYNLPWVD